MKAKEIKYNSQIEINDLIDDAVNNALARRNEVLNSEDALLALSDTEATNVSGGSVIRDSIITVGILLYPFPLAELS